MVTTPPPLQIVHLNTNDVRGGAARATFRLHQGLRQFGQASWLLVRNKQLSDRHTYSIHPVPSAKRTSTTEGVDNGIGEQCSEPPFTEYIGAAIQQQYINNNRSAVSNILFSFPYPGLDVGPLPVVQAADIIHLHWMVGFQSPVTLNALLQLGKPVVWTLHDMWAFTGGCHSSGHCTRYQLGCHDCPQLEQDPFQVPAAVLRDKRQLLSAPNLTVIAPSQNMASLARQSQLFKSSRIEVIHNSIDIHLFRPIDKRTAKQQLGLSSNARVIAFGSENGQQRSKGMVELIEVIRLCQQNGHFQSLLEQQQLQFVCCGDIHPDIPPLNLPLCKLGVIHNDARLRQFYAAADVFVQPSLEESFGNMAIESLCCGTPVIGFDVGVAREAIAPDKMGKILPLGDIQAMADAILDFAYHPEKWQAMSEHCHLQTIDRFSQQHQAQNILSLYQDLLGTSNARPNSDTRQTSKSQADELEMSVPWDCTLGPATQPVVDVIALGCLSKELEQVQVTLEHREERLQVLRDRIQALKQQLHTRDDELQDLQTRLAAKEGEIEAMKTSKFWKVRMLWMKVRSHLAPFKP